MSNSYLNQAFQLSQSSGQPFVGGALAYGAEASQLTQLTQQDNRNRTPLRNHRETPILPPQIPQTVPSQTGYQQAQQQQQHHQQQQHQLGGEGDLVPQPVYHKSGDPLPDRTPAHLQFHFGSNPPADILQQARLQQQGQTRQSQQQQQQQQQYAQYQQLQQQFSPSQVLPQTPSSQAPQQQAQHAPNAQTPGQDTSMQMLEDEEDDDDESGNEGEGETAENGGTEGDVPYVAPLVQPITPLQLPKVRPTLLLGPYDTRDACHHSVQEYAIAQGYILVQSGCAKQKTPAGKYTASTEVVRVDLQCDRGGTCKNSGTGKRKRPTHRLGCPTRVKLVCKKRQGSKWFIEIICEMHNHDLNPNEMHKIAAYRRWRRVQAGGPSTEPKAERYARLKKPKVIHPVPPPRFHQPGTENLPKPPAAPTSPLHMAALKGQCKIMEILLNKGADINAYDSTGRTPLHCGIEGTRMDVIKLLVERGADVNKCDNKGQSPMVMAVEKGLEDAVVLLVEMGADINT